MHWRRNEWHNILFSDEAYFPLHPDYRCIFIWRKHGTQNNPVFVHKSVGFGGGGVMTYAGISIDGHTNLHIIQNGALTGGLYRDENLRPIVVPYAAAIGDNFMLIDNNCRPHRAY